MHTSRMAALVLLDDTVVARPAAVTPFGRVVLR
jgi:hypothetical protein